TSIMSQLKCYSPRRTWAISHTSHSRGATRSTRRYWDNSSSGSVAQWSAEACFGGHGMHFGSLFVALFSVAAEPAFTAKVEKVDPPEKLAEQVRKLLDEQALVVRNGNEVVMRIWFRTEIPAKANEDQIKNGLTYREIPEGTLVGALEFPAKFI